MYISMCAGLKTLISDVPDAFGGSVAQRLTVRLLGGVEQEATVSKGYYPQTPLYAPVFYPDPPPGQLGN